jgi:predicted RNase H-like HicB family nuclease
MHRFLVVIEDAGENLSAYSPDLPGCAATGSTREEVEQLMAEVIRLHLDGLRADHLPIPESRSVAAFVTVA